MIESMKKILSSRNQYFTRTVYVLEHLLGFYLFFGGISTATSPTIAGTNAVAQVLGSHWSLVMMGIIFMVLGLSLILSNILDSDRMHDWTLMIIYACMFFTVIVEIIIGTNFADSLTLTILSGFLYLRAKRIEPWLKLRRKYEQFKFE